MKQRNKIRSYLGIYLITFFTLLLTNTPIASAQCIAPTSIGAPTIVNASCPGNGKVTVLAVTPIVTSIAPDYYQYALYDTLGNAVLPWQSSNELINIYAGTYNVWVRRVCTTGFSTHVTRRVVVNNTEVMSAISNITVNRQDHGCSNGRFTVSATGSTPLKYALVSGITAPEPIANYVRAPQTSNVFDSLPAGTYYVRVYNACNNAVTQAVTIPAFNRSLVKVYTPSFSTYACDSVNFGFYINNHVQENNYKDTQIVRAWVTWPNGTTDTMESGYGTPSGSTASISCYQHISKLDPSYNPGLSFWQSLGNFPYVINFGYRDLCGNVYTNSFTLQQPQTKYLSSFFDEANSITNCDSVATYFNIIYRRITSPAQTWYYQFRNMHNVMYSLDSGANWTNARAANSLSSSSNYFNMPRGISRLLRVAYCGDTISTLITPPAFPTLSANVSEYNIYSCISHTGMSLFRGNTVGDTLGLQMTAAPQGQPLIPYFKSPSVAAIFPLSNLLPGTYTIRIWDTFNVTCPRFIDRTITLTKPFSMDFSMEFNCNGSVSVISNSTYSSSFSNYALGSMLSVKIFNTSGALILGGSNGYSGASTTGSNTTTVSIPATAIASIPDGNYIIRAYKYSNTTYASILDTCTTVEKPWVKRPNVLSLTPSKFIPGCPGNMGSIVAIAQGGKAPYHYKLFDGSNNEMLPDASGKNIFDNLNTNSTYTLQVIDTCGTIVNRTLSVGQDLAIFVQNARTMPCPGDNVTLLLDSMPNVQYQWYKNNVPLSGQNQYRLQLNNISSTADSGIYKVQVVFGDCVVMTNNFLLNPADCGTPLPVQLADFIAYNQNGKGQLEWNTLSESDNSGFEIERSEDARIWKKVGFVTSKSTRGNSIAQLNYEYTDAVVDADVFYYRLKQINNDGGYKFSSIRKIAFKSTSEVSIFPNPVTENSVTVNGIDGSELINLYNMTGQLIKTYR